MQVNHKKREQTRQRIRDAVMAHFGYQDLSVMTVKDVCDTAGIHRSTFYLYYDSVDQVIRELRDELLQEVARRSSVDYSNGAVKGMSHAQIRNLARDSLIQQFSWMYDLRHYFIPLMGINGDLYFINQYENIIYQTMSRVTRQLDLQFKSDYALRYITGGVVKMVEHWLRNSDISVEELVDTQLDIAMQGFV